MLKHTGTPARPSDIRPHLKVPTVLFLEDLKLLFEGAEFILPQCNSKGSLIFFFFLFSFLFNVQQRLETVDSLVWSLQQ